MIAQLADLLPALRYSQLALVAGAVLLLARGRRGAALGLVAAWGLLGAGFWVVSLGRPFGLHVDPAATARAGELAVSAAAGTPGSLVVGEPARSPLLAGLAAAGVAPRELLCTIDALPALLPPLLALAVLALAPRHRLLGAGLVLAFATGDLDGLRGDGLATGAWRNPDQALLLPAIVALALALGRVHAALAAAVLLAWAGLPFQPEARPALQRVLALVLDQGPWLVLGGLGLRRGGLPVALCGSGGLLLLFSGAPWGGQALFRLGLLLAATGPLERLAEALGSLLTPRLSGEPRALGAAALLACTLPGSFLAWWDPTRLDPVYRASVEPTPGYLDAVAAWARRSTEPGEAFVVSQEHAGLFAALAGRPVLRAPGMVAAGDEERRARTEKAVLAGREAAALRQRYGLRHVLAAPGDFREHGVSSPDALAGRGGLREAFQDGGGRRVFALPGFGQPADRR